MYNCFPGSRNKKWDHASKKKEAKLANKLKVLKRRKDKKTKDKVKFSVLPEITEEKKQQSSLKSKSSFVSVFFSRFY